MFTCWSHDPQSRPNFASLVKKMKGFLPEDYGASNITLPTKCSNENDILISGEGLTRKDCEIIVNPDYVTLQDN